MIKCFLPLLVFFTLQVSSQSKNDRIEEVISLRLKSKDQKIKLEDRIKYAVQSVDLAKQIKIDSSLILSNRQLSLLYYEAEAYDKYLRLNKENIEIAQKLNDSTSIAISNDNIAIYFHYNQVNDSAYFYYSKALKFYDDKKLSRKATILLNIADLQDTEKDYYGSEENAINALKIFENLPETEDNLDNLWILNNLLGIVSLKLGHYDKSLEYHDKAERVSRNMRNGFYNKIYSTNNKAFVYRKKENYSKAIELYSSLIQIRDQYDDYDPAFYPLVIDNMAYTKLVSGSKNFDEMERLFKEAYKISDTLNDATTKLQISIDLSKFYLNRKQQDSSLKYANMAYRIAKETSSNEILLDALKVLSKLKEGEDGKSYLNEYIRVQDSLLTVERSKRDKFARIEFETDKVEQANERMSEQLIWLLAISGGLLVTLFLLYIIITQRAKNKELKFEKEQQQANEEIYNLMLSQQDKVDEARAGEKKRISEELHDGVLGRLFGTRLSLDSLNFSEGKEAISNRATYIKELMTIENDIRKISHDLNTDFVSGSGFMDIVSELIEKQTQAYQLKSTFNYTDDINWEMVHNKTKINIYRIIQESLQNIYKHANANGVKISIQLKNNVICLSIVDDGDGFDVNKSKKGIGIKNINSRVNEVHGKAEFNSIINKGTEVSITIPYKN
ncbi:Signal transduction histidine kinase [Formosa sp. Hel1_31_208]|uniref:ATP-binding protein n=1 Tax=Formosa sp. Hel1_31_208 TaxID=1798225 RepID=UPI00087AD440|nr:tetratricopeptide repeat-containing sensor histidine kinase [Formosa sp. Hel1_31_208]SDR85143.1 Signal transduction histidine kinase [Formosa sp. Hel1_31_208]